MIYHSETLLNLYISIVFCSTYDIITSFCSCRRIDLWVAFWVPVTILCKCALSKILVVFMEFHHHKETIMQFTIVLSYHYTAYIAVLYAYTGALELFISQNMSAMVQGDIRRNAYMQSAITISCHYLAIQILIQVLGSIVLLLRRSHILNSENPHELYPQDMLMIQRVYRSRQILLAKTQRTCLFPLVSLVGWFRYIDWVTQTELCVSKTV